MKAHKTSRLLQLGLLGGAGLFLAQALPARAVNNAEMMVDGTICRPMQSSQENDFAIDSSIENRASGSRTVICPVPADIDLGAHLEWTFTTIDRNPTAAVTCQGVSLNTDDTVAWTTATVTSADGVHTSGTQRAPDGTASSPKMRHYALCTLPAAVAGGILGLQTSGVGAIHMF